MRGILFVNFASCEPLSLNETSLILIPYINICERVKERKKERNMHSNFACLVAERFLYFLGKRVGVPLKISLLQKNMGEKKIKYTSFSVLRLSRLLV